MLLVACALALTAWQRYEYPRYKTLDLSVDKKTALVRAQEYLRLNNIDPARFSNAVIFDEDRWCNRYLQKTIGPSAQEAFLRQHDYDQFFWKVRFFKELETEEYIVKISPHTGSVITFKHLIDDTAPAQLLPQAGARKIAQAFLEKRFAIDLSAYAPHEEKVKRYEKRTEYSFSWEKRGVYIPWDRTGSTEGGAKLLIGAIVSGGEVREFYRNALDVPEQFERYIDNQLVLADYLYNFYSILQLFLLMLAIVILIKRRYDIIPRITKKWFCFLAGALAILNIADFFNIMQEFVIMYPTSARLSSFIGLYALKAVLNITFLTVGFIIPGLAGESLASEVFVNRPTHTFLHHIRSSFFTRTVARSIFLGYLVFGITLGIQALVFYLGQKYFGVWRDSVRLTEFSSAYIPLLSACVVSIRASLNEEITYRLFGISLGVKYLRNSIAAILLASVVWGLGHTGYAIFPVWFRIIEVSLIGVFYGFVFLRYGLIPLIVGHFLFDSFWGMAAYILGRSHTQLFLGTIAILCLPLAFALVAYAVNRPDKERSFRESLNTIQAYNLKILIAFVAQRKAQGAAACALKEELLAHNWDHTLVTLALREQFGKDQP